MVNKSVRHKAKWGVCVLALLAGELGMCAAAEPLPYSAYASQFLSKRYERCMRSSSGGTLPVLGCMERELQAHEASLRALYRKLEQEAAPDFKVHYKRAWSSWLAFRDRHCRLFRDETGDVQTREEEQQCLLQATAVQLQQMRWLAVQWHGEPTSPP